MYKLQRTIKFYRRSFMFFLRTSTERSQQSFFPLLRSRLQWKNFVCVNPNQKYLNILQYFSIDCSLVNCGKGSHCYANKPNSKECSIRLLTVSHQQNFKSAFKYSLGWQNNIAVIVMLLTLST